MISDGTVTATGGMAANNSYGIYTDTLNKSGTISITGGKKVEATGGDTSVNSYGMYAYDIICDLGNTPSGGPVTATGGEAERVSCGVKAENKLLAAYVYLTAKGGTATNTTGDPSYSYGIYASEIQPADSFRLDCSAGKADQSRGIHTNYLGVNSAISGSITATGGEAAANSVGIYTPTPNGKVSITATGDVTITAAGGKAVDDSMGIYTGALSVKKTTGTGNLTVTATGGTGKNSYGISATTSIDLSGTAVVSATGSTATTYNSWGIYASDLTVSDNAALTAAGGDAATSSYGIHLKGTGTLTGGSITATGGKANRTSSGFFCDPGSSAALTVSGGQLVCTGGKSYIDPPASYGIYDEHSTLTLTGGTTTAYGAAKAMNITPDTTGYQNVGFRCGDSDAALQNTPTATFDPDCKYVYIDGSYIEPPAPPTPPAPEQPEQPDLPVYIPEYEPKVYEDGWQKLGRGWYIYEGNARVKGWYKWDNVWYYLNPVNGRAFSDGIHEINGKFYYFHDWCGMASAWWYEDENGNWYYFFGDGHMAVDEWIEWKGGWYYCGSDGIMLTDTYTPDGYYVNASGLWTGHGPAL